MIYLFRNFKITEIRTVANDDGVIVRVHGTSDLTKAIAEKMKWEILHSEDGILDGIQNASLSGELNISKLSLIPNGDLKNAQIEGLPASIARNFKVTATAGEEGSTDDVGLKFVITAPATSAKRLVDYHLRVGKADAQLKMDVIGAAQMKLGEEESEPEAEPEAKPEATPGPTLASAPRRNRGKAQEPPMDPDTNGVPFA